MMQRVFFGAVSICFAIGLGGCGSDSFGSGDGGTDGTGTTTTGADGSTGTTTTGGSFASAFTGTYMVTSGMGTLNCNGQTQTATSSGTLTIVAGTAANTIVLTNAVNPQCDVTVTLTSATAGSAAAGQVCTIQENGGSETRTTTTNNSYALNGSTLTVTSNDTDTLSSTSGQSETCTLSGTIVYNKIGQ